MAGIIFENIVQYQCVRKLLHYTLDICIVQFRHREGKENPKMARAYIWKIKMKTNANVDAKQYHMFRGPFLHIFLSDQICNAVFDEMLLRTPTFDTQDPLEIKSIKIYKYRRSNYRIPRKTRNIYFLIGTCTCSILMNN